MPPPETGNYPRNDEFGSEDVAEDDPYASSHALDLSSHESRDTIITQEVPVRVLTAASVEGLHEPRCREPDVHIMFPPLLQLKGVSDRFTKLALAAKAGPVNASFSGGNSRRTATATGISGANSSPRLEMLANMHGGLRLSLQTDAMSITSSWTGLTNPELDPTQIEGAEESIAVHPSTIMKEKQPDEEGEEGWARVRIDGKDWGRVLSVGRLGGRVIACKSCHRSIVLLLVAMICIVRERHSEAPNHGCETIECPFAIADDVVGFCHELALILYVYLLNEHDGGEESVLTVCALQKYCTSDHLC